MKLVTIATVTSGVTFRSRIEPNVLGNVRVIQMKDLAEDKSVQLEKCTRIEYDTPKLRHLAVLGDIIFRSRGLNSTAVILRQNAESTIVAAPLLRVRAKLKKVAPEYLLWWINQASSQAYFSSRSRGTMVKMVSKQELEDLEVELPSLDQQKKIAKFFSLSMREQQLLEKMKKCKAIYASRILMQMASESRQTASNVKLGVNV